MGYIAKLSCPCGFAQEALFGPFARRQAHQAVCYTCKNLQLVDWADSDDALVLDFDEDEEQEKPVVSPPERYCKTCASELDVFRRFDFLADADRPYGICCPACRGATLSSELLLMVD